MFFDLGGISHRALVGALENRPDARVLTGIWTISTSCKITRKGLLFYVISPTNGHNHGIKKRPPIHEALEVFFKRKRGYFESSFFTAEPCFFVTSASSPNNWRRRLASLKADSAICLSCWKDGRSSGPKEL